MKRPLRAQLVAELTVALIVAGAGVAVAAAPTSSPAESAPAATVARTSDRPAFAPGRVLVKFARGTSASARAQLERSNHARVVGSVARLGVNVLHVPSGTEAKVVAALHRSGKVAYAERDALVAATATPNDTWWPNEWGPSLVNAPTAWNTTTGAASTVIAVLDSGVDFSQPDLQGAFVPGTDIVNNDSDPTDDNGHGTMAAGIAGARSNNGAGVASYCWTCSIMPVKVLDSTGNGTDSNVASGITWAADHGARVISMSLGGTASTTTMQSAVSYAESKGAILVAAAGNAGSTTRNYPAAYAGVLSVAGTTSADSLYSWSNYGSWVAVSGPGCNYTTGRNAWYGSFCGTSSATPAVAGLAGLAVSAAPSATATEVVSAIESSAHPIGSAVAYGRVDAAAALSALGAGGATASPSPSASPSASPTPSPTVSPTASPTPSTSASAATTTTSTASGTLSAKHPSLSLTISAGSGPILASSSFTKASSVTLTITDGSGGTVASIAGGSPVRLSATAASGSYTVTVTGPARATVSLSVTYNN